MVKGTTFVVCFLTQLFGQGHRSLAGDAVAGIPASDVWVAVRAQPVPRIQWSSVPLTPSDDRELNPSLQQLLFTNNSQGSRK